MSRKVIDRGSKLILSVPEGFRLGRAVCSYGYFLLAPNHWDPGTRSFSTVLTLAGGPLGVRLTQAKVGGRVSVRGHREVDAEERAEAKRQLGRMLRLEEDLRGWWKLNKDARRRGFGRLFRSATLWEDIVKTITGCNTTWGSTIRMNRLMTEEVGGGAFPTAEAVVSFGARRLKTRCKVGYRAERIVGVARGVLDGSVNEAWYEDASREEGEVIDKLRRINGIGPYAAANIAQLLGFYDRLPIDSETYRHFCLVKGMERPANVKSLDPLIEAHYEPMRPYRFLAYWFELWTDYERRVGPAEGWERDRDGAKFTAALLK